MVGTDARPTAPGTLTLDSPAQRRDLAWLSTRSLYKTTTRQQWEDAAAAWHRWGPTLEIWLGDATDRMIEAAGVTAGSQVLDVAAGAGGQGLAAAERTGASGRVVLTDISPTILTYAKQSRRRGRVASRRDGRDGR